MSTLDLSSPLKFPLLLPSGFRGSPPFLNAQSLKDLHATSPRLSPHGDNLTALNCTSGCRHEFCSDDSTPSTISTLADTTTDVSGVIPFPSLPFSMLPKAPPFDPEPSAITLLTRLLAQHASELSTSPRLATHRFPPIGIKLASIVHQTFGTSIDPDDSVASYGLPQMGTSFPPIQQSDQVDLAICAYIFCVGSGCFDKPQSISDSRFILTYHLVLQLYKSCPSPSTILSLIVSSLILNDRVETLQPSVWDVYHPGKASYSGIPSLSRFRSNTNDFTFPTTESDSPKFVAAPTKSHCSNESLLAKYNAASSNSVADKSRPFRASSFCYGLQQMSKQHDALTHQDSSDRLNYLGVAESPRPIAAPSPIVESLSPLNCSFESSFHMEHIPSDTNEVHRSVVTASLVNGVSSNTLGGYESGMETPNSLLSSYQSCTSPTRAFPTNTSGLSTFSGHDSHEDPNRWIGWGWTPEGDRASTQTSLLKGHEVIDSVRGQRLRLGLSFSRQSFDFFWRAIPYLYLSYIYLEDRPQTTLVRLERPQDNTEIRCTVERSGPATIDSAQELKDHSCRSCRRNSWALSDDTTAPATSPRTVTPVVVTPVIRHAARIRTLTSVSGVTSVHSSPRKEKKVKIVENVVLKSLLGILYSGVDGGVLSAVSYCYYNHQQSHYNGTPPLFPIKSSFNQIPLIASLNRQSQCHWCLLSELLQSNESSPSSQHSNNDPTFNYDLSSDGFGDDEGWDNELGMQEDWNNNVQGSSVLDTSTVSHLNEISEDARRKYYRFDEFLKSSNRSITALLRALSFRLHITSIEWSKRLFDILQDCPEGIVSRAVQMVETLHC